MVSQHTHSPALLRAAINGIVTNNGDKWDTRNSTVVSHPPSPTSIGIGSEDDKDKLDLDFLRPLNDILPLDPNLINHLPLSILNSSNSSSPDIINNGTNFKGKGKEVKGEEDYPLILVTGGSGFIGSHTVLEILQAGEFGVIVIDNLVNSSPEVLHRVKLLSKLFHDSKGLLDESSYPPLYFHSLDIQDEKAMGEVLALYSNSAPDLNSNQTSKNDDEKKKKSSRIKSAIHFAALKSVSASILSPIAYYKTNVNGTLNLISSLASYNIKKLVFSSSCVVYGEECDGAGIKEDSCNVKNGTLRGITNPYGRTKRMCEEILSDLCSSDKEWMTCSLRYTNPSGAHPSGYIGEDPTNAANLMPIVTHVLQGKRDQVTIFGADYNTPDGTGVRDFIHVVDLAQAHLSAIRAINRVGDDRIANCSTYNIGTNSGTSVLSVIETLSLIAQRSIKIIVGPRRPGDLGMVVCSAEKAERELGWKATRGLGEMCRDLVGWQALNPNGYASISKSTANTST